MVHLSKNQQLLADKPFHSCSDTTAVQCCMRKIRERFLQRMIHHLTTESGYSWELQRQCYCVWMTALSWAVLVSSLFSSTKTVLMIGSVLARTTKCNRVCWYGHLLKLSSKDTAEYKEDYSQWSLHRTWGPTAGNSVCISALIWFKHTNTHVHEAVRFLFVWPIQAKNMAVYKSKATKLTFN